MKRSFFIHIITLTTILIFIKIDIEAQWTNSIDIWNRIGFLYAQGDSIFACPQSGGLYLSINKGELWRYIGFENEYLTSLVKNGSNFFVGSYSGGIFKSSDNCKTWQTVNEGLPYLSYPELAVDGKYLFVRVTNNFSSAVFISSNGGEKWESISSSLGGIFIYSFSVNNGDIYVGTDSGVLLSTDKGITWVQINNGLPSNYKVVHYIFTNGTNIYADAFDGLYCSTDKGLNWQLVKSGFSPTSMASLGNYLYASSNGGGVISSSNEGQSWKTINDGFINDYILSLTINGKDIYAGGSGGGVYLLDSSGTKWKIKSNGLPISDGFATIYSFAIKGDTILAGTNSIGIVHSVDNGKSWYFGNNEMVYNSIYSITVKGNKIFAGSNNGLFSSTDNGFSWNKINAGLPHVAILGFLSYDKYLVANTNGSGVYLSLDNGYSWDSINTGLTNKFVRTLIRNNNTIYAGTENGVYQSSDNGKNWYALNNELTGKTINEFAYYGNYFLTVTDGDGFYYSTDNGVNWKTSNNGLYTKNIRSILIKGDTTLIGTNWGIWFSTNNDFNWTPVKGIISLNTVNSLTIFGNYILAGCDAGGIIIAPVTTITDIEGEINQIPIAFYLSQNYPNPFNPTTTIEYQVPRQSKVVVRVMDLLGREIETLVNEEKSAGSYSIKFNGSNYSSGVYFYQLIANGNVITKKFMLMK